MSEIEEVQEQIKADMEAMKEQMTTMIEVMMDMRKIIEVNIVAANTATERDPTHPPVFNQESHLVTDVEGQGGATGVAAYRPLYTQSHNRYTFHHMVYLLTIHHPWLYRCLSRTLLILSLFVLRIIKLNSIRLKPMTLIPGRRHEKLP